MKDVQIEAALIGELEQTRELTLDLVNLADEQEFRTAFHPDFSPVGWHLGHVATFEAFWVLQRAHGESSLSATYDVHFDPRQLAKPERTQLPSRAELLAFARDVRRRTIERLQQDIEKDPATDLLRGLFVYRFILAHEQQHAETIATVLRMRPTQRREEANLFRVEDAEVAVPSGQMLQFPSARIPIGEDDPLVGYDNERPAHAAELRPYEIDAQPVTNGDWVAFVEAGGYRRSEFWSASGWSWLQTERVGHPFHWRRAAGTFMLQTFCGDTPLAMDSPVEGINAHEADAYAAFVGKRLPTEREWENAARRSTHENPRLGVRCGGIRPISQSNDFIGNVWEWTSSVFDGYPGFRAFPYEGYSAAYFDGHHRVLRGGSWATEPRIARPSFRNWYPPHWRAMFAGLRCARDV